MSHLVFVSYSSHDSEIASEVCKVLEQHQVKCWMAPRDILPGTNYSAAIIDAINNCVALVLVYSEHSNRSTHVRTEVERAFSKEKHIMPLRFQAAPLSKEMEYFISSAQWLDASMSTLDVDIQKMLVALNRLFPDQLAAANHDENRDNTDTKHESIQSLHFHHQDGSEVDIVLDENRIVVGRGASAGISWDDKSWSRSQFTLNWDANHDTYAIMDTGASTPIWVNRTILRGRTLLRSSDIIECGDTTIRYIKF
jgi:hypothetical protein